MDREKMQEGKNIMEKIFIDTCKKFNVTREDIRDCTVRNIPARTEFIKECHKQCVPIPTIGSTLGDRTEACIQSYLDGFGGDLRR